MEVRAFDMKLLRSEQGFSLIETVIAMAISSVIITGIYQTFHSQQRSYLTQNRVVEMQQNLRAGVYLMVKDIRSIGYDPRNSGNFGLVTDFKINILPDDIDYT